MAEPKQASKPTKPAQTSSQVTHYPSRNGPVCGQHPPPTHASQYTLLDPSCPKCKKWIDSVRTTTKAQYGDVTIPVSEDDG